MSRTTIVVLIALGATFAGFVLASNAQRLSGEEPEPAPSVAAEPQLARVGWRETYGSASERIVFTVNVIEVTETGWAAEIGIDNESSVGWELAPSGSPEATFGLQLFRTGELDELESRNRDGALPAVRAATAFAPELPAILEPGAAWEGRISARGSLVAGAFVRVVFGTLIAVGKAPEELSEELVWITDSALELE